MNRKTSLIGIFIKTYKLLSLLEKLKYTFNVNLEKIRIYKFQEKNDEYLITLQTTDKESFLKYIENSKVLHCKNGCFFSINALNRLVEEECGKADKSHEINWEIYSNNLIILTNGELSINKIIQLDDKCSAIFNR